MSVLTGIPCAWHCLPTLCRLMSVFSPAFAPLPTGQVGGIQLMNRQAERAQLTLLRKQGRQEDTPFQEGKLSMALPSPGPAWG